MPAQQLLRIPTPGTPNIFEQPMYHAGIAHGFIGGLIVMLLIAIGVFHKNGWHTLTMQQRLKAAEHMM